MENLIRLTRERKKKAEGRNGRERACEHSERPVLLGSPHVTGGVSAAEARGSAASASPASRPSDRQGALRGRRPGREAELL